MGRLSVLMACVVLAFVCAACGGGGAGSLLPGTDSAVRGADNFQLTVLDDSFAGGGSADGFTLTRTDTADGVELSITAHNAHALKGLYASIAYDPRVWHAVALDPLPEFGNADKLLALSVLREPGVAWGGMVLQRYDTQPGYTGSGALMRLRLARGAASALRGVSAISVPDDPRSKVKLDWDSGTGKLGWYFANSGDYDQNGIVGISDLAPLGINFGKGGASDQTLATWVIDGNGDGMINIADLAPIGMNWQTSIIGGYHIYHSADPADYPTAATGAPDAAHLLDTTAFSTGTAGIGERKRFSYIVTAPVAEDYYWVRGCDGTLDGIASVIAGGPAPASDWPVYGRDAQHTHQSPHTGPQMVSPAFKFRSTGPGQVFETPLSGRNGMTYGVCDSVLYCADNAGTIVWEQAADSNRMPPMQGADGTVYVPLNYGLTALTEAGTLIWTYSLPDTNFGGVRFDNAGNLVVGCVDGNIYFITPGGTLDHTIHTGTGTMRTPIPAPDGTVYAITLDMSLTAYNADSTVKWSYPLTDFVMVDPCLAPDGGVVFSTTEAVVALSPAGAVRWQFNPGTSPGFGEPVCDSTGAVYVGDSPGVCRKLAAADGSEVWGITGTDQVRAAPALDETNGWVAFQCANGQLYLAGMDGVELWNCDTGPSTYSGAVFGQDTGTITVGGGDSLCRFFEGVQSWRITCGGAFTANPVLTADGAIITPCMDGRLYAIAPDGTQSWLYDGTGGATGGAAIGADGSIYLPCADKLKVFNADFSAAWEYAVGGAINSSPVIDDAGRIIFGCMDEKVYALNPDGTLAWAYTTTGTIDMSSPALAADGTVYIGTAYLPSSATADGKLYAINPDGTLKWSYQSGGAIWSSPTVAPDGTVYFCGLDAKIHAVNPADGSAKWTYPLGTFSQSSIALSTDGTLYAGDNDGTLYALNADGTLKWTADNTGYAAPVIGVDGIVYTGGMDSFTVQALNPADGSVKWFYPTLKSVVSAPTIGPDGTLYVGCDDGYLYAFRD